MNKQSQMIVAVNPRFNAISFKLFKLWFNHVVWAGS